MHTENSHKLFRFNPMPGSGGKDRDLFENRVRQEICIRPGLWLSRMNYALSRPICLEYEKKYPVIDFGFVISGNIKKRTGTCAPVKDEIHVEDGISGVRFTKDRAGSFVVQPDNEQKIIHLHMTLPFFRDIMKHEYSALPPELRAIMKEGFQEDFSSIRTMSPDVQAVVYQILNSSSNALPWHLYLEGKILELLSLHLAALSIDHQKTAGALLNTTEKKQIPKARNLLVEDLCSPPTLQDLCAHTGLSMNKLQAGFREVYGKSVFDYFREHRMQTAKSLLEKTETNVSETAWEVGYINVSHFSAAFKKRFGILPKQYLKTTLQRGSSKVCQPA